jgi:tetratricopeptide (TPR) repeat protein
MPLDSQAQRHLTAAEGYAELGMHLDANGELEEIDADVRHLPEVLVIRLQIYRALEKWDLMQVVARELARHDPENVHWVVCWAFATRRADSIEAAKSILLEVVERIPNAAILHYNLACYECRLGDLEVAKARLRHAFKVDASFRLKALTDEDLAPLWESL